MVRNKVFAVLASVAMVACSTKVENYVYNEGINIIPKPVELTQKGEGKFTFNANTVIVASGAESQNAVNLLAGRVRSAAGFDLEVAEKCPAINYVDIKIDKNLDVKNEGYTLSIGDEGVVIVGKDSAGAFYGVQSLLQLLPAEIESKTRINNVEWAVPFVEVTDYPRFEYRGLMLDVCRHFADVDFIKKQLDILSMYKINKFHFHLTEDQAWRIEIKKYPKLTEYGAIRTEGDGSIYGPYFYTQEDIKDIVKYAAEREIEVIPEIELPGHALAALSAYPEYACGDGPFRPRYVWGVEEDVFCAGNDNTFEFLQDVIDEVVELFPSQFIHIGGDECPKVKWEECPKCQGRIAELGIHPVTDSLGVTHTNEEQLQSYFIARMGSYIEGKGKKMIGWDEILEGGLADGAIVMSWRGVEGGIAAARMGHNCIMTPAPEGFYLDHYQGAGEVEETSIGGFAPWTKLYGYEPITAEFTPEMEELVMGVQGNMWTEYRLSDNSIEYMIYPRMMAVAEVNWMPKGTERDAKDLERRLKNTFVRLDYHGADYHIPMAEGVLSRNVVYTGDSVAVEFSNNGTDLPMVYTLDGSGPTSSSAVYDSAIVVRGDGGVIKIASMLPSGKLSVARTIPVSREVMSPAVESGNDGELRIHTDGDNTIRVRTAKGLFLNEVEFANAQFESPQLVDKFHGSIEHDIFEPSLSVYDGYIEFPEEGVYTFATDMAQFYIDGKLVIDNTKVLSRHNSHKVQKALKAGKHSYKLVVNNMVQKGWPNVWSETTIYYQLPSGGDFRPVTHDMVSY